MNFDPNFLPYHSMRYPVYAREGYPIASTKVAAFIQAAEHYKSAGRDLGQKIFDEWFKTFMPKGEAPKAGVMIVL